MLLRFDDGQPFSQGACTYLYRPATEREVTPRIFVPVRIKDIQTQVVVDTGGVYLICDPEMADLLDLDPSSSLDTVTLNIRGIRVTGILDRLSLTLLADEGQHLRLEVTAFIPRPDPHQSWSLPMFLGWMGCLERLRFAIDPATDTFHFGAIDPLI